MSRRNVRYEAINTIGLLLFLDGLAAGAVLAILFVWWWMLVGVGVALHVLIVSVTLTKLEAGREQDRDRPQGDRGGHAEVGDGR